MSSRRDRAQRSPGLAEVGSHFLDRSVVAQISIGSKTNKIYRPGGGEHGSAWVWTYLTACLATAIGLSEARVVVEVVQYGRGRR
jgi:hypothetical protein